MKKLLFSILMLTSHAVAICSPFHDECERATADPIEIYFQVSALEGREKMMAIEDQNQMLKQLKKELVVDSISQLVWSFIWRPYIESLTIAISTNDLPYTAIKQRLMNVCYEVADKYAALLKDIKSSKSIYFPFSYLHETFQNSNSLPKLITPFGNGWIDSRGVTYKKLGNSILDSNGNRIDKVGKFYQANTGETYAPFGDGYIDVNSNYSVRKFGQGFLDSEGRSVQPFGKGWVIR